MAWHCRLETLRANSAVGLGQTVGAVGRYVFDFLEREVRKVERLDEGDLCIGEPAERLAECAQRFLEELLPPPVVVHAHELAALFAVVGSSRRNRHIY